MTVTDADERAPLLAGEEHYAELTQTAVEAFWNKRSLAVQEAIKKGKKDADESTAVRGGQNLNAFNQLIGAVLKTEGFNSKGAHYKGRGLTVPGYYRYSKKWDVVLKDADNKIVGAIEFKSIVGGRKKPKLTKKGKPSKANSFGSNLNNRIEEAIGSGSDLRSAHDAGFFESAEPFFMGWVMVMEDHPDSTRIVEDNNGIYTHFSDADTEFEESSYIERANLFCQRAVAGGLYNSTALVVTKRPKPGEEITYRNMAEDTSIMNFIRDLGDFARHHASSDSLF